MNFKEEIEKDRESLYNVKKEFDGLTIPELQEICVQDSKPYSVCLLNVTGDLNIGVSIRTAALLGASKVIIVGRRKYDNRSTVGAQHYIPVHIYSGLNKNMEIDPNVFFKAMQDHQVTPILVEEGGTSMEKVNWPIHLRHGFTTIHPCLVFGNEGRGIPEAIKERICIMTSLSCILTIPQKGVLRSYNVSATVAMTCYELCRQMDWL